MTPVKFMPLHQFTAARRLILFLACALPLVTLWSCAHARVQTATSVPNDTEFGLKIEEISRAYESLNVARIMPYYTGNDYALSFETRYRFSTGLTEHSDVLADLLGTIKDMRITLDPNFEAWRDGNRGWTTRKFKIAGNTKKGEKFTMNGWHSAVWEKRDGIWLIWYEHFGGGPEYIAPPPPVVAAQPPVAPPPTEPAPEPRLEDVFFDFDKWNIRQDQVATLMANIEVLKQNPNLKVLVEGHCDERGGETYNMGLGDKRALSAKNYLIANGIDPARFQTVSYGKQKPFELGKGEPYWGRNRRAHFIIMGK